MRRPTKKETFVLESCLEGLRGDLDALTSEDAPLSDVLGTLTVNLKAMITIAERLK